MDEVNVSQDVTEVVGHQMDAILKTIEVDEKVVSEERSIDFGDCVGTVTAVGELDVKKFIDVAMELPTLRKKYGGRKMTLH